MALVCTLTLHHHTPLRQEGKLLTPPAFIYFSCCPPPGLRSLGASHTALCREIPLPRAGSNWFGSFLHRDVKVRRQGAGDEGTAPLPPLHQPGESSKVAPSPSTNSPGALPSQARRNKCIYPHRSAVQASD